MSVTYVQSDKTLDNMIGGVEALQPRYAESHMCTALIGSPGPIHMKYHAVSCNQRINVSGIICSKVDTMLYSPNVVYRVSHLKVRGIDSKQDGSSNFNIASLKTERWFRSLKDESNGTQATSPDVYESMVSK